MDSDRIIHTFWAETPDVPHEAGSANEPWNSASGLPRRELDRPVSLGLLKDQVQQLIDVFKFVWSTYFAFIAFVGVLNVTALGLQEKLPDSRSLVAFTFVFLNCIVIVGIRYLHRYTAAQLAMIEQTRRVLWRAASASRDVKDAFSSIMPNELLRWCPVAGVLAHGGFIIVWMYIGLPR
jgi:hypothetical protein